MGRECMAYETEWSIVRHVAIGPVTRSKSVSIHRMMHSNWWHTLVPRHPCFLVTPI
jgi:hypothetical protein